MKVRSLALRTDLIFNRFSGEVIDSGEYIVVRTPSRPRYYWGNYLIMKRPPEEGDLDKWIELFEKEISPLSERGFAALTWDAVDGEEGFTQPFEEFGFAVQKFSVLTATSVRRPPKYNQDVMVRPVESESDWEQYVEVHFDPDWGYGADAVQRGFLTAECKELREMVDCGLGLRFGAELDGKLVGELGIYWDGDVGRFNSVHTHRDYRRRGVCGALVYESSRFAFEHKKIKTLVMTADEGYHAAAIYESIGFVPTEKLIQLEWYNKARD